MEIQDNTMLIEEEDGSKKALKIYFYYVNEERGKTYYFLFDEANPDELIAMASKDGESLEELSDEEFEEAQEVLEAYEEDPKIAEAKA